MTQLTGIVDYSYVSERTGCVKFVSGVCTLEGTMVPYRALRAAELTFSTETRTRYETAATAALTPAVVGADRIRRAYLSWATSDGVLP
jgi:hypothetical protein